MWLGCWCWLNDKTWNHYSQKSYKLVRSQGVFTTKTSLLPWQQPCWLLPWQQTTMNTVHNPTFVCSFKHSLYFTFSLTFNWLIINLIRTRIRTWPIYQTVDIIGWYQLIRYISRIYIFWYAAILILLKKNSWTSDLKWGNGVVCPAEGSPLFNNYWSVYCSVGWCLEYILLIYKISYLHYISLSQVHQSHIQILLPKNISQITVSLRPN